MVLAAVSLAMSVVAETLSFKPKTKAASDNRYHWSEQSNWVASDGSNKFPEEGDSVVLDDLFDDYIAADKVVYLSSLKFSSNVHATGISHSGLALKEGGDGFYHDGRYSTPMKAYAQLYLDGEVKVDIRKDYTCLDAAVKGRSATQTGRFVKYGSATLRAEKAGDYWTGATLREGTFALDGMDGKSGVDIVFDGSSSAYFQLNGNLDFKDGALTSSATLPTTGNGVTDDGKGYALTISGTPKFADEYFAGGFFGSASFVFNPSDSAATFTFARATSTTTGSLAVRNGTVRMTDGVSFAALSGIEVSGANSRLVVDATANANFPEATLTISGGGKVVVAGGAFVFVKAAQVGGETIGKGIYSSRAGDFVSKAGWIEGEGCVLVGVSEGTRTDATWNGTGDASALANWNGAQTLPNLTDGGTFVNLVGGSRFTADQDVWLKGFSNGAGAFALTAATGKELWIGSEGIANPSAAALAVGGSGGVLALTASQTWTTGTGAVTFGGRLKSYNGSVLTLIVSDSVNPIWLDGAEIDPELVLRNAKVDGGYGTVSIKSPENACVKFNGKVSNPDSGAYFHVDPGAGSRICFENGFSGANCVSAAGTGLVECRGPIHVRDRFYIKSTEGNPTFEFYATGNRFNSNLGWQTSGTLRMMVPYAASSENNAMFSPKDDFVLDLNGNDQSVVQIGMHATGLKQGGSVTSPSIAALHIRPSVYWAGHNFSQGGFDKSEPDDYGYETADKGLWLGGASISYEANNGLVRSMMRTSSTTGYVEVVSGTLVFLRRAKTNGETFDLKGGSANPYQRLTNEDGAWPNATKVSVKGGVLKLEHGKAFGKGTAFELNSDGKLDLDAGVNQRCASLKINGVDVESGVYGSSASGAQHADDSVFSGQGRLTVGRLGLILIIE